MRLFVTIFTMLAWLPSGAQAQSEARIFACEGSGAAQGYPFGVQDIDRRRFRVVDDGAHPAIFHLDPTEAKFCAAGATCSVSNSADTLLVEASRIPNHDPGYSSRFEFHRGRLAFEASGGGLDGGWSVSGTCKAEPAIGD